MKCKLIDQHLAMQGASSDPAETAVLMLLLHPLHAPHSSSAFSPVLPVPHPLLCFIKLQEWLSCHRGRVQCPQEAGARGKAGALCGRAGTWCARSPSHYHSFWETFLPFSQPPSQCRLRGKHSFLWVWRLGFVRNRKAFPLQNTERKGMKAPRSSSASDEGIQSLTLCHLSSFLCS